MAHDSAEAQDTWTFVFTDIVDSTPLWETWPELMLEQLDIHDRIVSETIGRHGGHLFSTMGDGVAAAFSEPDAAVLAMVDAQAELAATPWPEECFIRVRMGAHTGEVLMQDDGDLFGKHVIVAARVGALATGGQILVSSLLKQIAEPRGDVPFGPPFEVNLKGIDGPSVIHEVDWSGYQPR